MIAIRELATYSKEFGGALMIIVFVFLIGIPSLFIGALIGWKVRKHKEPSLLSAALIAKGLAEEKQFNVMASMNRAARLIHSAETMDRKARENMMAAEEARRLAAEVLKSHSTIVLETPDDSTSTHTKSLLKEA